MGVSISLHVFDKDQLATEIHEHVVKSGGYRPGSLAPREFLEAVGNEFGLLTATQFMVVWNEYYEEYNPASEFLSAVDDYYFPGHTDEDDEGEYREGFFAHGYSTHSNGANAHEVLSNVFKKEFGYEGTLASYDF